MNKNNQLLTNFLDYILKAKYYKTDTYLSSTQIDDRIQLEAERVKKLLTKRPK